MVFSGRANPRALSAAKPCSPGFQEADVYVHMLMVGERGTAVQISAVSF